MKASNTTEGNGNTERFSAAGFTRKALIVFGLAGLFLVLVLVIARSFHVLLLLFGAICASALIRSASTPVGRLTKLPDALSIVLVLLILGASFSAFARLLAPHVVTQVNELARTLPAAIDRFRQQIEMSAVGGELIDRLPDLGSVLQGREILRQLSTLFSVTIAFFSDGLIFFFAALYFTFEPHVYVQGLLSLLPPSRRPRISEVIHAMGDRLRRWLLGTLVSMTVTGVLVGIGLRVLEVPLALTLGLLAGLLTFIPYVGALLSAVPALLLAFLQDPLLALSVAGLYLAAHAVEAYVVTPLVQQRSVKLPPILTLLTQVLLGTAGGILGLMLATPLAAITAVAVRMLYIQDVLGDRDLRGT